MAYNPFPPGSALAHLFEMVVNKDIDESQAQAIITLLGLPNKTISANDFLISAFPKWLDEKGLQPSSYTRLLEVIIKKYANYRIGQFSSAKRSFTGLVKKIHDEQGVGQRVSVLIQFLDETVGTAKFPCEHRKWCEREDWTSSSSSV